MQMHGPVHSAALQAEPGDIFIGVVPMQTFSSPERRDLGCGAMSCCMISLQGKAS